MSCAMGRACRVRVVLVASCSDRCVCGHARGDVQCDRERRDGHDLLGQLHGPPTGVQDLLPRQRRRRQHFVGLARSASPFFVSRSGLRRPSAGLGSVDHHQLQHHLLLHRLRWSRPSPPLHLLLLLLAGDDVLVAFYRGVDTDKRTQVYKVKTLIFFVKCRAFLALKKNKKELDN